MILMVTFDKVWVGDSELSNIQKSGQHSSFVDADLPEFLEIFCFRHVCKVWQSTVCLG